MNAIVMFFFSVDFSEISLRSVVLNSCELVNMGRVNIRNVKKTRLLCIFVLIDQQLIAKKIFRFIFNLDNLRDSIFAISQRVK